MLQGDGRRIQVPVSNLLFEVHDDVDGHVEHPQLRLRLFGVHFAHRPQAHADAAEFRQGVVDVPDSHPLPRIIGDPTVLLLLHPERRIRYFIRLLPLSSSASVGGRVGFSGGAGFSLRVRAGRRSDGHRRSRRHRIRVGRGDRIRQTVGTRRKEIEPGLRIWDAGENALDVFLLQNTARLVETVQLLLRPRATGIGGRRVIVEALGAGGTPERVGLHQQVRRCRGRDGRVGGKVGQGSQRALVEFGWVVQLLLALTWLTCYKTLFSLSLTLLQKCWSI